MPSIRIGFSTDFNLTREQVGIGTTLPTARLDVAGQILSDNSSGSGGVSTVTRYDGFLGSEQRVTSNISIAQTTKGNLNSLSGEIVIEDEVTVTDDTPLTGGRLDSLTVTGKFDLPQGGTEDREDTPEKGSTRFNQDLGQLEFYTGYEWRTTLSYDGSGRGRALFAGGASGPTVVNTVNYIDISTLGNMLNFGNLSTATESPGSCSSSTRGLFGGGRTPALLSNIDYITIASEGNGITFGSLSQSRIVYNAASSSTRGIFFSGYVTPSNVNTIDYVEISTLGNALDFGDVRTLRRGGASFSSPTRAIYAGGYGSPGFKNEIEFLTISSKGDMIDFGDLTNVNSGCNLSCSNVTRGIIGGGGNSVSTFNTIDYVTIATTGNAIDFGSLTVNRRNGLGGASSQIRGVFAGGYNGPTNYNTIDYITIATTGNAQDFGDMNDLRRAGDACSDSHGGLGGF